jgi:hypothetical protein
VEQFKTFTEVPDLSQDQIDEIISASKGKHVRAFVSVHCTCLGSGSCLPALMVRLIRGADFWGGDDRRR